METFCRAKDWLVALASEAAFFRVGAPPSLDAIEAILDALGRPDEHFAWRIIVTGSAGKGTCVRSITAGLLANGKTVCTLMSPHLQSITERIRIGNKLISKEAFGHAVEQVRQTGIACTFYEAVVAAGIVAGAAAQCEYLVAEIGIGGRLDAVNAARGQRVSVITNVGTDHIKKLGGSKASILQEKSGIITDQTQSTFTQCDQYKIQILRNKSSNPVHFTPDIANDVLQFLGLNTAFQIPQMPARCEYITPNIVLDGAHSAARFDYLIQKLPPKKQWTILLALTQSNERAAILRLLPIAKQFIFCTVPGERAFHSTASLTQWIQKEAPNRPVAETRNPLAWLKKAPDHPILVTGSFYLCGLVREAWFPQQQIADQQTEFPV